MGKYCGSLFDRYKQVARLIICDLDLVKEEKKSRRRLCRERRGEDFRSIDRRKNQQYCPYQAIRGIVWSRYSWYSPEPEEEFKSIHCPQ